MHIIHHRCVNLASWLRRNIYVAYKPNIMILSLENIMNFVHVLWEPDEYLMYSYGSRYDRYVHS